jgi:outer membrane protein TolC
VLAAREGYQAGSTDFNSLLRLWEALYSLEMEAVDLEAERFEKIFELARILNLIQPAPPASP